MLRNDAEDRRGACPIASNPLIHPLLIFMTLIFRGFRLVRDNRVRYVVYDSRFHFLVPLSSERCAFYTTSFITSSLAVSLAHTNRLFVSIFDGSRICRSLSLQLEYSFSEWYNRTHPHTRGKLTVTVFGGRQRVQRRPAITNSR